MSRGNQDLFQVFLEWVVLQNFAIFSSKVISERSKVPIFLMQSSNLFLTFFSYQRVELKHSEHSGGKYYIQIVEAGR